MQADLERLFDALWALRALRKDSRLRAADRGVLISERVAAALAVLTRFAPTYASDQSDFLQLKL